MKLLGLEDILDELAGASGVQWYENVSRDNDNALRA